MKTRRSLKTFTLITSLVGLAIGTDRWVYGQGTIVFNNLGPNDGEVILVTDFWSGTAFPLDRDLNFQLRLAPVGEPLFTVRRWLLSDGTANGINVAPGRFDDPTHSAIVLEGIPPHAAINVEVDAWTGNYATIDEAVNAGAGYGFGLPWSRGAGTAEPLPTSLEGMPRFSVRGVPEPGVIWLVTIAGLGFVAAQTGRSIGRTERRTTPCTRTPR